MILFLAQTVAPRSDMQDNWLTTVGLSILCIFVAVTLVRSYFRKGE